MKRQVFHIPIHLQTLTQAMVGSSDHESDLAKNWTPIRRLPVTRQVLSCYKTRLEALVISTVV